MKYFFVFIVLYAFGIISLYSQHKVKGIVKSKDNQEIIYDVILYNSDSTLITGSSYFQPEFVFNISNYTLGDFITIRSLGYQSQHFNLNLQDSIFLFSEIQLIPDFNKLEEIKIVSSRKVFETKNGNTKVNIINTCLANSGSGIDVIRKLPGVLTNDRNIEVIGKGKPLILIDDRESSQSELEMLSSDQIASIEIIKNAGAEYSASAKSVLKITTLTQKYNGWNFKVTNQITKATNYRYYGALDLGYMKNNSSYYFHFGSNPSKIYNKEEYHREFIESGYFINNIISNNISTPTKNNVNFNTNQKLSKNSSIYFQSNNYFRKKKDNIKNYNEIINKNSNLFFTTEISSPTNTRNHIKSLNYKHNFRNNGVFSLLIDYAFYKEDYTQNINEYFEDSKKTSSSNFNNKAQTTSVNPQFEYNFPNSGLNIKTGVRYANLNSNSTYIYREEINNEIQENLYASYVQLSKSYNKINLQFGLRYEHSKSNATKNGTQKLFDREINNLFPNVSFEYKLSENLKTNFSYAYKTTRPNLYDITSYNVYVDSLTSFSGNPNLMPEYSYTFDYGLVYREYASLNISYTYTENPISHYINYEGINTNVIQDNLDKLKDLTITMIIPYKYKFWTTYNTIGFNAKQIHSTERKVDLSKNMIYLSLYNSFKLKNLLNVNVFYQYNTKGLYGIFEYKPRHILNLNLSKQAWNNKVEIYLQFNDIFNRDVYNVSSSVEGLSASNYKFSDMQQVRLSIKFKLNQINNLNILNVNNNELNRIKQD